MSIRKKNTFSENDQNLADMWPLVVAEERWDVEGPVIMQLVCQLVNKTKSQIVDLCGAIGTEVMGVYEALKKRNLIANFDVVYNEFSEPFSEAAKEKISSSGSDIKITKENWLSLNEILNLPSVALLLCIGNSFCSLQTQKDRKKAVQSFYDTLNEDGIIIIDERNPELLKLAEKIVSQGLNLDNSNYPFSSYPMYSSKIRVEPVAIDDQSYTYEYSTSEEGVVRSARLKMYRLLPSEIRKLLYEVGFEEVITLGDWKLLLDSDNDSTSHNFKQHIGFRSSKKAKEFKGWMLGF